MQLPVAVRVGQDGRVVPRCDGVEPEGEGFLEQGREFDALVAAHARIRGTARGVLGDEVVDDVELEALGEIPHVVRNADDVGRALGIHRVLDGAASARSGAERAGHPAERQVDTDDVVAGVDRARRSDGGVHSPAHRRQNLHAVQFSLAGDLRLAGSSGRVGSSGRPAGWIGRQLASAAPLGSAGRGDPG